MRALTLLVLSAIVAGCGGGSRGARGDSTSTARPASGATRADSARQVVLAESIATTRDEWNVPEVVRRLTEAGLVVKDSGAAPARADLHVPGELLRVSGSTLEVFIYPSATARRRDSAAIDTTNRGLPDVRRPRWIFSGNLIAIHHTPDDHLAERVELALTARHLGGS